VDDGTTCDTIVYECKHTAEFNAKDAAEIYEYLRSDDFGNASRGFMTDLSATARCSNGSGLRISVGGGNARRATS
jgi:hypothetical protein